MEKWETKSLFFAFSVETKGIHGNKKPGSTFMEPGLFRNGAKFPTRRSPHIIS